MRKDREVLKHFISYYKPHKRLFFIDIVCAFIISLVDLLFPALTRNMIKHVIPNGFVGKFGLFIGAMVAMYIIRTILHYVVHYWGHILGVRIEYDMRRDFFPYANIIV